MAGHVRDVDQQLVLGDPEIVEEVAAEVKGRLDQVVHMQPAHHLFPVGQHSQLNLAPCPLVSPEFGNAVPQIPVRLFQFLAIELVQAVDADPVQQFADHVVQGALVITARLEHEIRSARTKGVHHVGTGAGAGTGNNRGKRFGFLQPARQIPDGLGSQVCKDDIRSVIVKQALGCSHVGKAGHVEAARLKITGEVGTGLFIGVNNKNALGARCHGCCPKLPSINDKLA